MKFHATSSFKEAAAGHQFYQDWVTRLEKANNTHYKRYDIATALGATTVWGSNTEIVKQHTLVVFPGFRTSVLFWDFDNALSELSKHCRIYLVDTNGQPNFSDGNTPDIKSLDYGHWAAEVMDKLGIEKAHVAGASFGGLVCLKLAQVAPQKIKKVLLLNPGCLAPFSLSLKNLYSNLLPIFSPSIKNVVKFLDTAVFCPPHHHLPPVYKELIVDYEVYALQNFNDKGQKPYAMKPAELNNITSDTYLLLGEKDLLFPYQTSKTIAEKHIATLKGVYTFPNTAHGIVTSKEALGKMSELLK